MWMVGSSPDRRPRRSEGRWGTGKSVGSTCTFQWGHAEADATHSFWYRDSSVQPVHGSHGFPIIILSI